MVSPGTFGGFGAGGIKGRTGFPSGSPSGGPWSRFHHPSCVGALRLSAGLSAPARAGPAGVTVTSSRARTAARRTDRLASGEAGEAPQAAAGGAGGDPQAASGGGG